MSETLSDDELNAYAAGDFRPTFYGADPHGLTVRSIAIELLAARKKLAELEAAPRTGVWPNFVAPPEYDDPSPGWSDPALPDFQLIWKIAREAGYAIGLHGSMKRDCDLIAAPWVAEAASAQDLINRLCVALNAREVGPREAKPHGRIAVNLQIDGYFRLIDLSIAPAALPPIPKGD